MVTWKNLDTLASYQELEKVEKVNLAEVMSGENGAARVLRSYPAEGGQMLRLIAEEKPKYGKVEQAAAGLEDLYMYLFG